MKQRLAIAAALLMPRELLVLDEPTNGLDPQGTREVRALVAAVAAEGATVLLSTHLLAEVEQVCTHVGVMHRGHLVAQAPLADLRTDSAPRARVLTDQPADAAHVLRSLGLTDVTETAAEAAGQLGSVQPEKVVAELVHDGVPVRGFAVESPSLEDVFVRLTGSGFDVSG
jgi:ABC-2 type transport system ATP-binding protein